MSNARLLELATRHGALRARIAEQRRTLARQAQPLVSVLARGDEVLRGVDWLKHHPAAVALALAATVAISPRRAWRWGKRGFFLWRGWQSIRRSLARMA